MQAHPVPQNITGFEFKLIGFLTIRQFGYLAAVGVVSFVIYILPLYGLIKASLIVPLALLGLALTFLPVNDMPFDRWVVAFIRSVYSPTQRIWHKERQEIGFLAPEFAVYLRRQPGAVKPPVADRSRLQRYLAQKRVHSYSVLDAREERQLALIAEQAAAIGFKEAKESTAPINTTYGNS